MIVRRRLAAYTLVCLGAAARAGAADGAARLKQLRLVIERLDVSSVAPDLRAAIAAAAVSTLYRAKESGRNPVA